MLSGAPNKSKEELKSALPIGASSFLVFDS
jgi:hypothetical protein